MIKILVTGASGFIGARFVRHILSTTNYSLRALVRNSDQRNLRRLDFPDVSIAQDNGRLHIVFGDLLGDISGLCEDVDWVVHFAARTFVNHSIKDVLPFLETNVMGTYKLLEDARRNKVSKFVQIGTDEVYGAILSGCYNEDSRINPTNPYSASKAGADALAISYAHTYGLNTIITRTENNYGPMQHPQKVLPVFVKTAMRNCPLPIYGDGMHVRQWLYVTDHCRGIVKLLETDCPKGEVYHIAGNQELTNLDLARRVLKILKKPEDLIQFIPDHEIRPGHDRRYALSCDKLKKLGWQPSVTIDDGIQKTVEWYKNNPWWTE